MVSIRRIVVRWGRRIVGGLVAALLFSQMALAVYACPRQDSAGHVASMQAVGMAMEDAVGMPSMPDCHAMPGTMDDEAPQLCAAHCDGDGRLMPWSQGLDIQFIAAHAVGFAYVPPVLIDTPLAIDSRPHEAQPDSREGAPPLYLTFQSLRN